jgi:hypothetical protein
MVDLAGSLQPHGWQPPLAQSRRLHMERPAEAHTLGRSPAVWSHAHVACVFAPVWCHFPSWSLSLASRALRCSWPQVRSGLFVTQPTPGTMYAVSQYLGADN